MQTGLLITVVVAPSLAGIVLLLLIIWWCSSPSPVNPKPNPYSRGVNRETAEPLESGIAKVHHMNCHHQIDTESNKKPSYSVFRRDSSLQKCLFSWSDHPSLVTDAVEHGWSRFAFTTPYTSSPSVRSSLLGHCAGGQDEIETRVEISWEITQGSADFVQRIRFNPGLQKIKPGLNLIKTSLPLPGPPLGNSSFPQEAYFEITILKSEEKDNGPFGSRTKIKSESEKAKLIQQRSSGKGDSHSLVHALSFHGNGKLEDLKSRAGIEDGKLGEISASIGLVRGGSLPLKFPGSYPGSVGFNSDGSIYLEGVKLVLESRMQEWGEQERVIGCGYNPTHKRVFFTMDSRLVHVVSCRSDEFGAPLYPALATARDITVLVNFGQSAFRYSPANFQRTPNPCFVGPSAQSPKLGYDDSGELFSMGRIDSQWLNTRSSVNSYGGNHRGLDFDVESEGDLFEIPLDSSSSKSPSKVLH